MHMDGRLIIGNKRLETPEKITSINPSNLEAVGEACLASQEECQKAILTAKEALPLWRSLSLGEKKEIFKGAKKILLQRSSEVAHIITLEKGSPFVESLSVEVLGSLDALDYYASAFKRSLRAKKAKHHVAFFSGKKSSFQFEPLGVTLVISPWNFPFLIPFSDILSAMTAGNTVIFRPSTSTPFVALLIGEILIEAGLPPGVLNIVPSKVSTAESMITNPDDASLTKILEKSLILFHHDLLINKTKAVLSLLSHWSRIVEGSSIQNLIKMAPRLFKK